MTDSRRLRPAQAADIGFVTDLLDRESNWDKLESYSAAELQKALSTPLHHLLIWDQNRSPLGFTYLTQSAETPGTIKLEEFAMDHPGKGNGTKLMPNLFKYLHGKLNAETLWLYVATDNQSAQRFYLRHGFTEDGTAPKLWHRRKGAPIAPLRLSRALP